MEREFHIWVFTKRLCGVYGDIATGKGHTSLPAAKPRHLVARVAGHIKSVPRRYAHSGHSRNTPGVMDIETYFEFTASYITVSLKIVKSAFSVFKSFLILSKMEAS